MIMNLNELNIVAFDYYDGVTEGLISSVKNYGSCYFKVIAWDDMQNERLYIVSPVDQKIFSKLVNLLVDPDEVVSAKQTWIPKWTFKCDQDAEEANNIVRACRGDLSSLSFFILGESVDSTTSKIIEIDDRAREKIIEINDKYIPGNLNDWIVPS
jgi:hypothetical protein